MPDAFQIARAGMSTSSTIMDTHFTNITNAQTPGYSKKVSQASTMILDGEAAGVKPSVAQRLLDPLLAGELRDEYSLATHLTTKASLMKKIEQQFGTPGDKNSLGEQIRSISNAFETLSTTPTSTIARKDVLNKINNFSYEISRLSGQIQGMRQEVDNKIATAIAEVDTQLSNVKSLNEQIAANFHSGKPTGDLEDSRDKALNIIAKHMDIQVTSTDEGIIYIQTGGGNALLFPDIVPMTYNPTVNITATSTYDPNPVTSTINHITVTDSLGNIINLTPDFTDGDIAAYIEMRDTVLPNLQQQLDRLCTDFRDGLNALHNTGTGYPPPDVLTGTKIMANPNTDLFQGAGTVRFALIDKANGQMVGGNSFDLDLTAMGNVSVAQLAVNIQAGLAGLVGTATATCDASTHNQLVLNTGNAAYGIGIVPLAGGATETVTGLGFSHYFGLNDLIITPGYGAQGAAPTPGICQSLGVRADILTNDQYLARGAISSAAVAPLPPLGVIATGDSSVTRAMVNELVTPRTFSAAGGLTNISVSYIDYGSTIITTHAASTSNVNTRAQSELTRQQALEYAIGEQVGVDVQEEFADAIAWQQVFIASSHVVGLVKERNQAIMAIMNR
ncbi:MAG: flagellar hook-associated protein FlgK [Alphaproteobacteria bacterium]|jgi:flagellar hook-associated protein 1 FlgK|nr:flagellar hook-associated protein FlgK [Alphaproteobacteria bacterium]